MGIILGLSHLFPFFHPAPKSAYFELIYGGYTGVALPVPIPNTEVKYAKADDTRFIPGK